MKISFNKLINQYNQLNQRKNSINLPVTLINYLSISWLTIQLKKYKLNNPPINQLINRSVINNQLINRSVTLTYGVQTFLAPVGTVISTCPRRDLGLNIGQDLITRNPEGPISAKHNHNLNTHYIRGAMSEKYYGVLYMSCSLIWYK